MRKKIIAFESANSFVKVFSDGRSATYPNTVTKAPKESFGIGSGDDAKVYTVKGQRVNVGLTHNYQSSSSESVSRYSSPAYFTEAIIAISHFAKDGDSVTVVTGLPSDHYRDRVAATKAIEDSLQGTHSILIDDEEVEFTITKVIVTLQPLASFFYSAIDEYGEESTEMLERFNDSETMVIDIGWGTTDIAVCRGYGLVQYETTDTSMKTAYMNILDIARQEAAAKGDTKLRAAKIKLLDLEKQVRKNMKYKFANVEYPMKDIYARVMEQTAIDVFTEVNNFSNIGKYTTVLLTGGGTRALLPYLVPLLNDPLTGELYNNVFVVDDAQLANVKGYYVFAKYLQQPQT